MCFVFRLHTVPLTPAETASQHPDLNVQICLLSFFLAVKVEALDELQSFSFDRSVRVSVTGTHAPNLIDHDN